jgi:ABC-2 type transport system ATP-binding protein
MAFMRKEGRTIIISSHQLTDLERLADNVGIIHHGKVLLSGRMDEIVSGFRQVDVEHAGELPSIDGIRVLRRDEGRARVMIELAKVTMDSLHARGLKIVAESPMTLEEMFVALVKE